MTAATAGPSGPNLFSTFSLRENGFRHTHRETFLFSLLGQVAILAIIIFLTTRVIVINNGPIPHSGPFDQLPIIFAGKGGGGGGNHDPLPASHGHPPTASLENQFVAPTVRTPTEMPKLPMQETVIVAPEVKFDQTGPIGDMLSKFTTPSDGPGGPDGMGKGCCKGIGDWTGPHVGNGPESIYPAGKDGTGIPQVIYSPEPNFSDEARKTKTQGRVGLMLVVGKDGRTYNIRVRESLGMGLDEKAIEAVRHWRFKPATRDGEPVDSQIAIEVDFHLY